MHYVEAVQNPEKYRAVLDDPHWYTFLAQVSSFSNLVTGAAFLVLCLRGGKYLRYWKTINPNRGLHTIAWTMVLAIFATEGMFELLHALCFFSPWPLHHAFVFLDLLTAVTAVSFMLFIEFIRMFRVDSGIPLEKTGGSG